MEAQTDTVARPVGEVGAVAALLNDLAADLIHLSRRPPRPHRIDAGQVGL